MRRTFLFLCAILAASAAFSGTGTEVKDIVDHPFSTDFASGGRLRLKVQSGEIRIVGTDENRVSVEVSGRNAYKARDMKVRVTEKDGAMGVRISGGPHNEIAITIRIPRVTDLYARVPFGDLEIENVEGNKDVAIHAGDLTIDVGDSANYAHVDASVATGDLDGRPFGEEHGGLFRSFHKQGNGKYRLYAHVGAGDLTLR